MADLVIRDMEMPISCEKCPFNDYEQGFCFAVCEFGNSGWPQFSLIVGGIKTRHPKCPLVPIPEGHGRIVDAAEILEKANNSPWFDGDVSELGLLLGSEVTTIVPAEGGREKCSEN